MTTATKLSPKETEVHKATLRLFNGIHIPLPVKIGRTYTEEEKHPNAELMARTVAHGYILDNRIGWGDCTPEFLNVIESVVGISGVKANASFHKSWKVIEESSMAELVIQQIVHYFTTYGFESLGIYNEASVYIPNEKLEVPDLKEDISLTVVRALDTQDVLDGIIRLGGSGVALAQNTLDDIMTFMEANADAFIPAMVKEIQNRELKALLSDFYGIVPTEPVEFFRHLISKLTDESLLIKNDKLIAAIKAGNGKFLQELLRKAPDDLASIFFRYKPLFLAMKLTSWTKLFINQLRRKAEKMHKPLPEDYMNNVTKQIKCGTLTKDELVKRLATASVFRKIRLAYALNFRLHSDKSIVYRVRSGKGWATEFDWPKALRAVTKDALDTVVNSIAYDVRANVEGRTIYMSEHVNYALPATEKQFVGNVPNGTSISVPEDMICGAHWYDVDGHRIDLDLAMISIAGKTGWDASYKSEEDRVLFSGDLTAAPLPNGAMELFYLKKGVLPQLMTVNYFNHDDRKPSIPVPTKIIVAHEKPDDTKKFRGHKYMVDPNNIVGTANIVISEKQSVLGLVCDGVFYFTNVSIGNARSSSVNDHTAHAREYLISNCVNSLSLKAVLETAGAKVVTEKPEDGDFIDLSFENLDKTTILDLLK